MKKALTILSAAVLLLAAGCNKNSFSGKGGDITFGTVSGNIATRTAYGTAQADSIFTDGKLTHIAIVWNEGDKLRIISPEAAVTGDGSNLHYADYTVQSVKTTDENGSSAAVVNTKPNGLAWTGASTYSFYAVYPSSTPISLDEATYGQVTADFISATPTLPEASGTKVAGDVTYTVYTPDISGAVMTAVATGVKENDNKPQVNLHFKPAFTAIEFNLSSKDDDVEITQIQLVAEEGDTLAAPFKMTAGAALSTIAVSKENASNTVTLNTVKNNNGITLTQEMGATLTMLLLPKANTQALKFRVTSKEGDGTKTSVVSLSYKNGNPLVLEPGKKYYITGFKVPGSYWRIFFTPDILDVDAWEELGETSLIVE